MKLALAMMTFTFLLGFMNDMSAQDNGRTGSGAMKWTISTDSPPAIRVASPASEPIKFASSELARYMERILGHPLPASAGEGGPAISLAKMPDTDLGDEGFGISVAGNVLQIRSGGDAGIVFGVYEFLRRYCGCRFSGLGPDGELAPRRDRIVVDGPPIRMKPKLWYRSLQLSRAYDVNLVVKWIDWMAKNGLNYVMFRPSAETSSGDSFDPETGAPRREGEGFSQEWFNRFVLPEIRKRGMKLDMNHHNLFFWLPPGKYFKEHPEWFPLVDGKRQARPMQLAFCTSNREAVAALIENVKRYLRQNPEVRIVGVIPEDGFGLCLCEECARLDPNPNERFKDTKQWRSFDGNNRAKIRRYALLLNEVARALREEFPNVLVGGAAYVDMTLPDEEVEAEPNIVVWMATYWRNGAYTIAPDSPAEENRFFHEVLRRWQKTFRGRFITYSYYMGMNAQRSLPYPMDRVICQDWPTFKSLGVGGATIQCWPCNHDVYALNLTAFARNAWQDRVDPDAVLDECLEGMFGSAAAEVKPMVDAFHEVWQRSKTGATGSGFRPNARNILDLLDALGEGRLDDIIHRARQAARDDRERRQIEKLAKAAAYWKMAAKVYRLEDQAAHARQAGDQAALGAINRQGAEETERILAYLDQLPSGWGAVTLERTWKSQLERFVPKPAEKK